MTSRSRVNARVLPSQMERADTLRQWWAYHTPSGPYPSRNLILTSALTKGLRRLDLCISSGTMHSVVLPETGPVRTYPRVRFDVGLTDFADRLRGPLYELLCSKTPPGIRRPAYPSRASILFLSVEIGLDALTALYARPAEPTSLQAS